MPNPNPTQTPEFLEKQFRPKGAESLGKVVGVRFPLAIDALLQTLPDKTDFIRQAVIEKLEREKLLSNDVDVSADQAIAPKATHKRQRVSSTRQVVVNLDEDEDEPELEPETLIHIPSGDRGWVDKRLPNGRYAITLENGITDDYPRRLLRVQA